jgi:phosphate transport system substrate-binding protein
VKSFVDFFLANASTLADETKYVPLPPAAYEKIVANLASGKMGSAFKGEPATAMPIEALLERESRL